MSRLCKSHKIITVNGQFPGPTLDVHNGDAITVKVTNKARYNVTIHWYCLFFIDLFFFHFVTTIVCLLIILDTFGIRHGLRQMQNPWADGPEYVTQCPIMPGGSFTYRFIIQDQEGTLWWHAHSRWLRATVYGALVIRPKLGSSYPFPKPKLELPVLLGTIIFPKLCLVFYFAYLINSIMIVAGEWWNREIISVLQQALFSGAGPNISDALTINGQPGDLYKCSRQGSLVLTEFVKSVFVKHVRKSRKVYF